MGLKVVVDMNVCQDHGQCVFAAPEVFGADDYGTSVLLIEGDVPAALEAKVRRAEGNCPERAITIEP